MSSTIVDGQHHARPFGYRVDNKTSSDLGAREYSAQSDSDDLSEEWQSDAAVPSARRRGPGPDATPPTSIPGPEKNLPQALVYQIEEWLQQKGGNLPCTFMGRPTRMNYNLRGKSAVFWMHKSGN